MITLKKLLDRNYRENLLARLANYNSLAYKKSLMDVEYRQDSDDFEEAMALYKSGLLTAKIVTALRSFEAEKKEFEQTFKYLKAKIKQSVLSEEKQQLSKMLANLVNKNKWYNSQTFKEIEDFNYEIYLTNFLFEDGNTICFEEVLKKTNAPVNKYFYIYKKDMDTMARAAKNELPSKLKYIAQRAKKVNLNVPLFVTKAEYLEFENLAKKYFSDKNFFKILRKNSNFILYRLYNYQEPNKFLLSGQTPFDELNTK